MILKRIYDELVRIRIVLETVHKEKLQYLKQASLPIAQADKIDYSKVDDSEVVFDVDFAKEVEQEQAEIERRLWEGKG